MNAPMPAPVFIADDIHCLNCGVGCYAFGASLIERHERLVHQAEAFAGHCLSRRSLIIAGWPMGRPIVDRVRGQAS